MKIRLRGTEEECLLTAERLMRTPGLLVLSVSEPWPDRGASVRVRVYIEAQLNPPPLDATVPNPSDHGAQVRGHFEEGGPAHGRQARLRGRVLPVDPGSPTGAFSS